MTVKDAINHVKNGNLKGEIFLIARGHKLLKIIKAENQKPEFHHKVRLMNAFMECLDDDLDCSSTLGNVVSVRRGQICFSAHCRWTEGYITIPASNLELSHDEIRKKCLDYAVKHLALTIKNETADWKEAVKDHEEEMAELENDLANLRAIKKKEGK